MPPDDTWNEHFFKCLKFGTDFKMATLCVNILFHRPIGKNTKIKPTKVGLLVLQLYGLKCWFQK